MHPAFAKTYYVSSYLTLLFKTGTLRHISPIVTINLA
nr:MAG TPA: hypothetical protein [Caudoviricetes sp.]